MKPNCNDETRPRKKHTEGNVAVRRPRTSSSASDGGHGGGDATTTAERRRSGRYGRPGARSSPATNGRAGIARHATSSARGRAGRAAGRSSSGGSGYGRRRVHGRFLVVGGRSRIAGRLHQTSIRLHSRLLLLLNGRLLLRERRHAVASQRGNTVAADGQAAGSERRPIHVRIGRLLLLLLVVDHGRDGRPCGRVGERQLGGRHSGGWHARQRLHRCSSSQCAVIHAAYGRIGQRTGRCGIGGRRRN